MTTELSVEVMSATYTPQSNDQVTVGRHGRPMTVIEVYPVGRVVTLQANSGERMHAEWCELSNTNWEAEARSWNDELLKVYAPTTTKE